MFADVELLLVHWLPARLVGARVLTDTPADMAKSLPLVQVSRFGGADSDPVVDVASVDVDAYAATRGDAARLCEQVREALRFGLPGQTVDGVQVYAVDTIGGPSVRPFDVTGVRRFGATFRLTVRKVGHNG